MVTVSPPVQIALGAASVAMFVATLVAIPVFFVRIPPDYFARPRPARPLPLKVLHVVLGVALIALGLLMLVLPGQGILTILVGLSLFDLPIKDRLVARLLSRGKVINAVNELRRRADKAPLLPPSRDRTAAA